MIRIAAIGLTGAVLTLILRQQRPELAAVSALASGLVILFLVMEQILPLMAFLRDLSERYGLDEGAFGSVLRIVGVAYIGEFGVQACKDAGEASIAAKVELGAKVIILGLCLPIAVNILELLSGLLPG